MRRGIASATLCALVSGLLGGCDNPVSGAGRGVPDVPAKVSVYLNCGGPPARYSPLYPPYEYDIDGDGSIDRFVALRCPGGKFDQVEVFTGRSSEERPERLSGDKKRPLVHLEDEVDLESGCLMFSDNSVLIGELGKNNNRSAVKVRLIGRWIPGEGFDVEDASRLNLTIPCGVVPRPPAK